MTYATSSWRSVDALPSFMPSIAPITLGDATIFATRYLDEGQREAFMVDHNGGDTLARWWTRLDADTRHTIFVDCILSDGSLFYGQRLEAANHHPQRNALLSVE